jgi:hypothetical protein
MVGRFLVRVLVLCAVLLTVSACDEASEKADTEKQPGTGPGSSSAARMAATLIAQVNKPWKGDYTGMVERRTVRVLLPYSKTFFFVDKGQKKGINHEFFTRFTCVSTG